jgi:hypothetical protein
MAEERTLGLARAQETPSDEDPSKEELQRRMNQARDSISNTVTEIKETVANQVQAVKDTLDWREQFKKRPVAWSAGAVGVGFVVGYSLAAVVRGAGGEDDTIDFYTPQSRSYAAQPITGAAPLDLGPSRQAAENGHDEGPSLFQKLTHTPAFGRVKAEASSVGEAIVEELGKTAKTLVLPALMTSLRNFLGDYLPKGSTTQDRLSTMGNQSSQTRNETKSSYQPTLEHK